MMKCKFAGFCESRSKARTIRCMKPRTGQQGLVEIANRKPAIILLDLGLPDMEGLEVLKRLA